MIRRSAVALIALLMLALGTSPGAAAAPAKKCGDYAPGGGAGVFDIGARVTSCTKARRMARSYYKGRWTNLRSGGRPFRRGSYTCRLRNSGFESSVIRCTAAGGRVVRWTAAA